MTTYLVTIFLCFVSFLFNFSSARIPFQIYDIIERSNTNTNTNTNLNQFSVSENNPTDPIDKPTTLIQWENEKTSESEPKTEPTQSSNGIPLTVFISDPSNPRHPLPLRIRHRCHHYKPWKPSPREIVPIVKTRGGPRHMARGWTRFGHVDPMLHRQRGMDMEKSSELLRSHYQRRHRDDEDEDEDEDDDEDEYEAADNKIKDDTGFVKRIRKFLNQF